MSKEIRIQEPRISIPKSILPEFSRLIMMGTQFYDSQSSKGWTPEEKKAYKFAKDLIKEHA